MNIGLSILDTVLPANTNEQRPPKLAARHGIGFSDADGDIKMSDTSRQIAGLRQGDSLIDQAESTNRTSETKTYNINPDSKKTAISGVSDQFGQLVRNRLGSDVPGKLTNKEAGTASQAAGQQAQLISGQVALDVPAVAQDPVITKVTDISTSQGNGQLGESTTKLVSSTTADGILRSALQQRQLIGTQGRQTGDVEPSQNGIAAQTNQKPQTAHQAQVQAVALDKPAADTAQQQVMKTVNQNVDTTVLAQKYSQPGSPVASGDSGLRAGQNGLAGAEGTAGRSEGKVTTPNQNGRLSVVDAAIEQAVGQSSKLRATSGTATNQNIADAPGEDVSSAKFSRLQVKVTDQMSAGTLTQKSAVQQAHILSASQNSRNTTVEKDGLQGTSARGLMGSNIQLISAESTPPPTKPTGNQTGNMPSDVASSLREQIFQSIRSSLQNGDRQITINLHPPELGKVSIKFQEQAGQITGSLEVSNSQTRAEIQQALPEIIRTLEQSGIQLKRLEVNLSDSQPGGQQQTFREQSPNELWADQHNLAQWNNQQQGYRDAASGQYQAGDIAPSQYQTLPDLPATLAAGETSINILA